MGKDHKNFINRAREALKKIDDYGPLGWIIFVLGIIASLGGVAQLIISVGFGFVEWINIEISDNAKISASTVNQITDAYDLAIKSVFTISIMSLVSLFLFFFTSIDYARLNKENSVLDEEIEKKSKQLGEAVTSIKQHYDEFFDIISDSIRNYLQYTCYASPVHDKDYDETKAAEKHKNAVKSLLDTVKLYIEEIYIENNSNVEVDVCFKMITKREDETKDWEYVTYHRDSGSIDKDRDHHDFDFDGGYGELKEFKLKENELLLYALDSKEWNSYKEKRDPNTKNAFRSRTGRYIYVNNINNEHSGIKNTANRKSSDYYNNAMVIPLKANPTTTSPPSASPGENIGFLCIDSQKLVFNKNVFLKIETLANLCYIINLRHLEILQFDE